MSQDVIFEANCSSGTTNVRATDRMASIEWLRVLSMIGIICFHVTPSNSIHFLFGTGIFNFLLLGMVFNISTGTTRGLVPFAKAKWNRLMVPWAFWVAVYGVLLAYDGARTSEGWTSQFDRWMLLYGTRIHLWFVPFSLAGGVLAVYLHQSTRHIRDELAVAGFGIAGGLILFVSTFIVDAQLGLAAPIPQYLLASSSPFLGLALHRAIYPGVPGKSPYLAPIVCITAAAVGITTYLVDGPPLMWRMCIGIEFVAACYVWHCPSSRLIRFMTPCMFGVYLVHLLAERLLYSIHLLPQPANLTYFEVMLHSVAIFAVSLFIVWAMRKTPLKRFT